MARPIAWPMRRGVGMLSGGGRTPEPALQAAPRWYRADMGVTLVSGRVSNWANQGTEGAASDYSQGTAGLRPIPGTLNGQTSIVFSSARPDSMTAAIPAYSAAHIFTIFKINTDPPAVAGSTGFDRSGTGLAEAIPFTDSIIYDCFASNARKTTVDPGPSLTTIRCYERFSGSGEWSSWLDGTQLFTTGANVVAWRATSIILGGDLAGRAMDGEVCEQVIFSTKRTTAQRQALASYFNSRYTGLAMAVP